MNIQYTKKECFNFPIVESSVRLERLDLWLDRNKPVYVEDKLDLLFDLVYLLIDKAAEEDRIKLREILEIVDMPENESDHVFISDNDL